MELHLGEVDSLKGKRHVLRGMKEKVKHRFQRVESPRSTMAICGSARRLRSHVCRTTRGLANEVVSKAVNYIESLFDGEVIDVRVEVL